MLHSAGTVPLTVIDRDTGLSLPLPVRIKREESERRPWGPKTFPQEKSMAALTFCSGALTYDSPSTRLLIGEVGADNAADANRLGSVTGLPTSGVSFSTAGKMGRALCLMFKCQLPRAGPVLRLVPCAIHMAGALCCSLHRSTNYK